MKLVDGLSPAAQAAVIARHGAAEQSAVAPLRIHVVEVPAADLSQALQAFGADPQVESVEAVKTRRAEWLSNDAFVADQWSLARIGWPTVYSTLTPTGTATVALLDTGVEGTHPDLQGHLRPGTSLLDGGDGLTDPAGHGTQLAGLLAAVADNQQGIAGVAFSGVKVMPVTVLDAAGVGQDSAIIAGIVWAADHGADVILMGFGNPDYSAHLQDAIDYAWSKGAVLVAAAGNAGATAPSYPAANRAVIGIAASDQADRLATFSNRGGAIFLAAPGTELATTDRAGGYATVSGTSPAAAIVAGAAALLKAAEPTLTNGQVLGRLARGAAPVADPQEAPDVGFGRVDLAAALADTGSDELAPLASPAGVYRWPTPAALAAAEEAAALAAAGATDPAAGPVPLAPADTRADTGAAAQPADYTAASSDPVLSDTPVDNFPVTSGKVNAVAVDSATGITYIGGAFTFVGPYTGHGAPIDTATGQVGATFPKVNGNIFAAAADGSGGWYIGGDFTIVNGVARGRLAHIQPDGTLDGAWNPNADNIVNALVVSGTTVYVGGQFTIISDTPRNRLAAITVGGTLTAWDPDANNHVRALAVIGSTVYAGGDFTTVSGTPRLKLAAIDTNGTFNTTWNPNNGGSTSSTVYALAVNGTTLYVGGSFSTIGATTRSNLAAITSTGTGTPTDWNPNADDTVLALAMSENEQTVYAGGYFDMVGNVTHNRLASIATAGTGAVATWDPNLNGDVLALAVKGTTLYAGGTFTTVGGTTTRNRLAAFATDTGAVTAWDPSASASVSALALSGTSVYAGGHFITIGGAARNRLAAMAADGTLTAWNPNANATVYALALSGQTVYVGGAFGTIGGIVRSRLAAIGTDGILAAWNPNANDTVNALAVAGTTVYVGGWFSTIGSTPTARSRLAAIAADGTATTWNPNPGGGSVNALAVGGTTPTLYVGGGFTTMGPSATVRNRLAAFDISSGALNPWDPNAGGTVVALAVSGSTVYAGGSFTTVNTLTRNRLAAIDTTSSIPTAWNPNASGEVYALAVSGTTVYAGGAFTTIGGTTPRRRLAAIDATSGTATTWNPNADSAVYALAVNGTALYAGGVFDTIGGNPRSKLAKFQPSTVTTTTVAATPNPAAYGAAVTLTATLSPTTATGSVTFMDDTTTLGTGTLAGGSATYVTSALTVGGHSITADYAGDTGYSGSTSAAYSLTIDKAGQTISFANPGTQTYGTSPTLSASATSGLAVTFTSTTPTVCTITSGGLLTFLTVGPCTIAADQGGNANFNAAPQVTQGFEVAKANPSVSVWPSASDISYGQTLAASVLSGGSATPAGGFAFTTPGTAPAVGTASQGVTFTPTDTARYNTAADSVSVTVDKAAQAVLNVTGPGAVTYGATGTATATGGSGTGALSFSVGASTGCAVTGTTVSVTNASGTCALTATRAGDGNYDPATSAAAAVTLNKAVSTALLVADPNPATLGQSVQLTATVTAAGGTGTVTFMDGAATLGNGPLSGGTTTLSTSALSAGSHSLTAVYAGDDNYLGATSPALTQVVQVPVTIATNPAGLTVTVDGTGHPAPYSTAWTPGASHQLAVSQYQGGAGGTRAAFAAWSDGGALSHTVTAPAAAATFTAAFATQYQLTTAAAPASAGLIAPATGGWFAAGTTAPVTLYPVVGYAVASWTVNGTTTETAVNTQPVLMSGPMSVTATLAGAQPELTAGVNSARTGTKPIRTWTLTLTNRTTGAGPAPSPRFDSLTLTQTYPAGGPTCTPVVGTLPTLTGPLGVGASLSGTVGIDFTGCTASARFQATLRYSDGGRAAGLSTLNNQPQ